ncbi:putative extracellular protein, partial [Xylaria flabelliformis]
MLFKTGLMAILAAGSAMAHMNMNNPPPLGYKGNPNTQEANKDYSITSPITAAQYPCKNTLKLLGTSDATPVATYSPGQQTSMTVEGGAPHNGGSCQLSLSYDKGTSFTVIKSFHGGCPLSSGQKFDFTIPSDAPEGDDVVFAWTWVNKTGNREFYMSCAIVNIKAGGGKRAIPSNEKRAAVAFADRPQVFQANLGGKYCTAEGVDTQFPDPGPDV